MKFIHISDLHIGRKLEEYSLAEDQKFILDKIIEAVISEKPDALLIAGDIYDRSLPPTEAVTIFDDFLYKISKTGTETFIISGNHDSAERLSFGNRLMDGSGIHISGVYDGTIRFFDMKDEFGTVRIHLFPFIRPHNVRQFFPDEKIESFTDAARVALSQAKISTDGRNVLVCHQFVTGAQRYESEEIYVGGSENIDADVFDPFDYVALGHLHSPQNVGSEKIRYCGTPLKYSLSEADQQKSLTVAELGEKGELRIREIPLKPMRDYVKLKGRYSDLMDLGFYSGTAYPDSFVHIILTDEDEVPYAVSRLGVIYKYITGLRYDNTKSRHIQTEENGEAASSLSPYDLFSKLYGSLNGREMNKVQSEYIKGLIEDIWEAEDET